jgi:pre-mRNA-splicing factor CWC26
VAAISTGLKTGSEYAADMASKKAAEDKLWANMNTELSGQHAETVIRGSGGKKLEMLNEFLTEQAVQAGKAQRRAKEEYEWGKGLVQKQDEVDKQKELEDIKNQPFARYQNDPRLEAMRKQEIRADDPMAAHIMKKRKKAALESGVPEKQEYKGPPPRPNRFGMRPGYRWDGIDRGNGFEQRWFKKQAELKSRKEDAHAWSTQDM